MAGFTSAATIWFFAVFGLVVGVGEYLVGTLMYATVWSISLIDNLLEKPWIGVHRRRLQVDVRLGTSDEELAALGLPGKSTALAVSMNRERQALSLTYSIDRVYGETAVLERRLEARPEILCLTIESA